MWVLYLQDSLDMSPKVILVIEDTYDKFCYQAIITGQVRTASGPKFVFVIVACGISEINK